MEKQTSLDMWHTEYLTGLLRRKIQETGGRPAELYRQTIEESDDCYKEVVCTITLKHIIEQMVVSGGPIPPSFVHQDAYPIDEYPSILLRKSPGRFLDLMVRLERDCSPDLSENEYAE